MFNFYFSNLFKISLEPYAVISLEVYYISFGLLTKIFTYYKIKNIFKRLLLFIKSFFLLVIILNKLLEYLWQSTFSRLKVSRYLPYDDRTCSDNKNGFNIRPFLNI